MKRISTLVLSLVAALCVFAQSDCPVNISYSNGILSVTTELTSSYGVTMEETWRYTKRHADDYSQSSIKAEHNSILELFDMLGDMKPITFTGNQEIDVTVFFKEIDRKGVQEGETYIAFASPYDEKAATADVSYVIFTYSATDGLTQLSATQHPDGKFLHNGRLVIYRNGRKYDVMGR